MGSVDQGFVPAPPERVYARLADVERYPTWWPGARASRSADGFELRLPRLPAASVRLERERPGSGFVMRLDGALAGSLEWYLEPFREGTIVNAIFDAEPEGRRTERVRRRLRRELRNGLVALRGATP